jgi:hypothetical protein
MELCAEAKVVAEEDGQFFLQGSAALGATSPGMAHANPSWPTISTSLALQETGQSENGSAFSLNSKRIQTRKKARMPENRYVFLPLPQKHSTSPVYQTNPMAALECKLEDKELQSDIAIPSMSSLLSSRDSVLVVEECISGVELLHHYKILQKENLDLRARLKIAEAQTIQNSALQKSIEKLNSEINNKLREDDIVAVKRENNQPPYSRESSIRSPNCFIGSKTRGCKGEIGQN